MSDVATAPAPAAPVAAPAPAPTHEAVINPNPTNAPTPVGSQAPDKPDGQVEPKSSHISRREAIKAAFDKAAKDQAQAVKAKPAEAKIGHNQPPEETEKEPQPRDRGRFTSPQPQPGQQSQESQKSQPQSAPLPETAPYRDPPPRLSDKAKAEWSAAPESVRGDVHRIIQETEGGIKRYRADHEAMNTIRPYHELATKQGTTLGKALSNYVGMEEKLRTDPLGGLDMIVNNLNLRTPDGRQITLRDVAHHIVSRTPEQLQMMQHSNSQAAQTHQIQQLQNEINELRNQAKQAEYQQRYAQARPAVDAFADTHPRFDELSPLIQNEFVHNGDIDLEEAYLVSQTRNEYRNRRGAPDNAPPHAAQTRTSTPAQTRPADKSISGAPNGPSNGTWRRPDKPVGRREAIQNAINSVNGSL